MSGGKVTHPLQFPSIVQLTMLGPEGESICTATKVGPRKYLTAAHCVSDVGTGALIDFERITISHGIGSQSRFRQELQIKEIHVNPFWKDHVYLLPLRTPEDRLQTGTDQAVIETLNDNRLPSLEVDFEVIKEGENVFAAGYGIQSIEPGKFLPHGQFRVTKKIISGSVFQPKVISVGPQDASKDTYSQFAPGDSGGPILRVREAGKVPFRNKVTVVGIMSFISDMIYVDPDTGRPVMIPEGSSPTSYFVRTQGVSYLQNLSFMNGDFGNWLKSVVVQFKL